MGVPRVAWCRFGGDGAFPLSWECDWCSGMKKILLLDYDHTLYPSTLPTLKAVDDRINLYIRTFLGLTADEANATRMRLFGRHGTTLKGLEEAYGVDREHYCDFIHAVEDHQLPPPDPEMHAWLQRVAHPFYLFTNARLDWVVRGLTAMGLRDLLPESPNGAEQAAGIATDTAPSMGAAAARRGGPRLQGIFDITFTNWEGKPHAPAYAKVDAALRARHGEDIQIHFADDRSDNLEAARQRGWRTIWIAPPAASPAPATAFDCTISSLTHLDPAALL
jgi:FMN phosphatase YigB (HAD superfamily)